MTDYRFRWDAFDCPFCSKTIGRPHVKRHMTTHSDVPKEDADVAWIRWLEAQEEVSAENADRMVAIARRRTDAGDGAMIRHCLAVHGDMVCDGPQGHDGGCIFTPAWELIRRLEDETDKSDSVSDVLVAFQGMWPDFAWDGCYDLDDLLHHAEGQLGQERDDRG